MSYERETLTAARALCAAQAEDEALWCPARTVVEAHLQAALRRLHAEIEAGQPHQQTPIERRLARLERMVERVIGALSDDGR